MKRPVLTVLGGLVVLALVSQITVAAVVGSPDFSATLSDDTVAPGEETTLDIVLVNSGDIDSGSNARPALNSEVTTARGLTVRVASGDAPISVQTGPRAIGSFGVGASPPLSFDVSVDEDATPGSYRVPVVLGYEYYDYVSETASDRDEVDEHERVFVTVRVTDDARFDVTDVDSAARVDSTGTVAVTVENTGDDPATDAAVSLSTEAQGFAVDDGTTSARYVDNWTAGEARTFRYRVTAPDGAEPEPYLFDLSVAFEDRDGTSQRSTTTAVGIAPEPEQTFSVASTGGDVAVGTTGSYRLTLRNDGPVSVTDATVSVTSSDADITFGGSNSTTRFLGEWDPGETRTVTVDATAGPDAEPRSYALSTRVTYEDPEGDQGQSNSISVGVRPEARQTFAYRNLSVSMQGTTAQVTGQVVNTGARSVDAALVTVDTAASTVRVTEGTTPVGPLAPGESARFRALFQVAPDAAPGPRRLHIAVQYDTDDGDTDTSETTAARVPFRTDRRTLAVEPLNNTLGIDTSNAVRVRLKNVGDVRLTDVRARLAVGPTYESDNPTGYVASLAPGEATTMTFEVTTPEDGVATRDAIPLNLTGETPAGRRIRAESAFVPITITRSDGGVPGSPIFAGVAVVVVALAAGWWWLNR